MMAYMVGVGRGDCTGPPVGVNFVSSFLFKPAFFSVLLFFRFLSVFKCVCALAKTHRITWFPSFEQ